MLLRPHNRSARPGSSRPRPSRRRSQLGQLAITIVVVANGVLLVPASANYAPSAEIAEAGPSVIDGTPGLAFQTVVQSASGATFDAGAPFVVTGDSVFEPPHIDTDGGAEPSAEDVSLIAAATATVEQPQNGFAYATAEQVFAWQGADEIDIDVTLTAKTDIDDAVIDIVHQSMLEYRQAINLEMTEPHSHKIEISWVELPTGTLAAASTTFVTVVQEGQTFLVPLFLADSLSHSNNRSDPSFRIYVNSDRDWDLTLNPTDWANTKTYLKSVMLHEIGHGLGFSAAVGDASDVPTTLLTPWSRNLYVDQDLTRPYATLRDSAIQTNNLWFSSSDGTWERVYDPTTWRNGSSLSHLNEATYIPGPGASYEPGAMMTPAAGAGEIGVVDGVIGGVLSRLGYQTYLAPQAPEVSVAYAGETVTATLAAKGAGLDYVPAKAWQVVLRTSGGATLASQTLPAANNTVVFEGQLAPGAYTVNVVANTDGNTASVAASFNVEASATTTTSTNPEPTTSPPTTGASTTVPSTTATQPTTTVPFYATCSDVRLAGAAPILASNPSFDPNFDDDGDGVGCERSIIETRGEPQLANEAPQLWYRFQIARLYNAYFGRYPEESGWQYWNGRFVDDEPLAKMSQFFSESSEFQLLYGDGLSNAQFVSLVYTNVLGRLGEPEGMAFWESQLDGGMIRGELMIGFSESVEFIYNSGPTSTNTCWSATGPFDTAGLRDSYLCAAGETPSPS